MLTNFIYAKSKALFEQQLEAGNILDEAIVFIEDTKEIWNHGHYFAGEGVDITDFNNLQIQVAEIVTDKLDKTEIKTINGQSILGEGDLTIGWTEEEFNIDDIITPNPNVFYYNYNPVSHLRVRKMTLPYPAPHRMLSKIVFKTADSCSLTLPTEVYWANGVIPEILPNTIYELSIEYSLGVYKAILLPFNQV